MKRLFWVALGLGAGAAAAISASRWTRRQAKRVAPQALAREAKGSLMDLTQLVSQSLDEGRQAMRQREIELRAEYDLPDGPDVGDIDDAGSEDTSGAATGKPSSAA